MASTTAAPHSPTLHDRALHDRAANDPGTRRVRHDVRDSLAVMAFSAISSLAVAVALTLLVRFGS